MRLLLPHRHIWVWSHTFPLRPREEKTTDAEVNIVVVLFLRLWCVGVLMSRRSYAIKHGLRYSTVTKYPSLSASVHLPGFSSPVFTFFLTWLLRIFRFIFVSMYQPITCLTLEKVISNKNMTNKWRRNRNFTKSFVRIYQISSFLFLFTQIYENLKNQENF